MLLKKKANYKLNSRMKTTMNINNNLERDWEDFKQELKK